jgi:hypothetical protein
MKIIMGRALIIAVTNFEGSRDYYGPYDGDEEAHKYNKLIGNQRAKWRDEGNCNFTTNIHVLREYDIDAKF